MVRLTGKINFNYLLHPINFKAWNFQPQPIFLTTKYTFSGLKARNWDFPMMSMVLLDIFSTWTTASYLVLIPLMVHHFYTEKKIEMNIKRINLLSMLTNCRSVHPSNNGEAGVSFCHSPFRNDYSLK